MNEKCNTSGKKKIYLKNQSCLTQNYQKLRRISILSYFYKSVLCIILTISEGTNKYQKLPKDVVYFIFIAESKKRRVNGEQSLMINLCEKQSKSLSESFFPSLKWEQLISLLEKNEVPKICFLSLALTPILNVTPEILGMFSSDTWGFSTFPGRSQLYSSSFRMWHLPWKGTAQSTMSRAVTLDVSQQLQIQHIFPGCVFLYHTHACSGLPSQGLSKSAAHIYRQFLHFPIELLCQECPGCFSMRVRNLPLSPLSHGFSGSGFALDNLKRAQWIKTFKDKFAFQ